MWKPMFASMHDVLDDAIRQYPSADAAKRQDLHRKLDVLKTMSDSLIEEWLRFEEKMSRFLETVPKETNVAGSSPNLAGGTTAGGAMPEPAAVSDAFKKGQGYFQLLMYDKAIVELEKAVKQHPDFMLARLYLAMSHMRGGNDAEAYRHFRFIASMTDQPQIKAISYNAMGCIQAKNANMEQARQLFKLAYTADPTSVEPMINMGICLSYSGQTQQGQGFIQ